MTEIVTLRSNLEKEDYVHEELPISVFEFAIQNIKTEAFDFNEEVHLSSEKWEDVSQPSTSNKSVYSKKSNGKWKCSQCSYSNVTRNAVERHMKTHYPSFPCNDCGSLFMTRIQRLRHRETEHKDLLTEEDKSIQKQLERDRIFKVSKVYCNICGKPFFEEDRQEHLRLCIDKKQEAKFYCDLCGMSCKWRHDLRLHMHRYHLNLNGSSVESDGQYKCYCGKTHKDKETLRRHIAVTHEKLYLKTCEQCGKVLKNSSLLTEHIRVFHTEGGQNNFMCKECGKFFNFKTTLIAHEKKVHGEKIFECQHEGCDRKFTIISFRNSHYRAAHVVDRCFQCPKCPKAFTTRTRLNRHVTVMHDKLTDKCPVNTCKYRTGRRDNMRTHLKRHFELTVEDANRFMEQLNHMNFV